MDPNESYRKPTPKMWMTEEPSVKKKSLANEKRISKKLGFKLTPGSGNQDWPSRKGDGVTQEFVFELKETIKDRFTISPDVLAKVCREAGIVGKVPVLVVSMYGLEDPIPKEWAMIPIDSFNEMKEKS